MSQKKHPFAYIKLLQLNFYKLETVYDPHLLALSGIYLEVKCFLFAVHIHS